MNDQNQSVRDLLHYISKHSERIDKLAQYIFKCDEFKHFLSDSGEDMVTVGISDWINDVGPVFVSLNRDAVFSAVEIERAKRQAELDELVEKAKRIMDDGQ